MKISLNKVLLGLKAFFKKEKDCDQTDAKQYIHITEAYTEATDGTKLLRIFHASENIIENTFDKCFKYKDIEKEIQYRETQATTQQLKAVDVTYPNTESIFSQTADYQEIAKIDAVKLKTLIDYVNKYGFKEYNNIRSIQIFCSREDPSNKPIKIAFSLEDKKRLGLGLIQPL